MTIGSIPICSRLLLTAATVGDVLLLSNDVENLSMP